MHGLGADLIDRLLLKAVEAGAHESRSSTLVPQDESLYVEMPPISAQSVARAPMTVAGEGANPAQGSPNGPSQAGGWSA